MAQHDVVAALGHDRQFGAGLVGPHAEAKEAGSRARTNGLYLFHMARGLGAGLVQGLQRCARQLELAGRLEADGAIGTLHRDDVATLFNGLPAELTQREQQIADAAGLAIGGRVVILLAVDQLFMLGADAPAGGRLLAGGHGRDELVPAFNRRIAVVGILPCAHGLVMACFGILLAAPGPVGTGWTWRQSSNARLSYPAPRRVFAGSLGDRWGRRQR